MEIIGSSQLTKSTTTTTITTTISKSYTSFDRKQASCSGNLLLFVQDLKKDFKISRSYGFQSFQSIQDFSRIGIGACRFWCWTKETKIVCNCVATSSIGVSITGNDILSHLWEHFCILVRVRDSKSSLKRFESRVWSYLLLLSFLLLFSDKEALRGI